MATPKPIEPPRTAAQRWESERDGRRLLYVVALAEESHLDASKVPEGQARAALLGPYERRGVTDDQIQGWVAECDPATKPSWDPVECFRAKARQALRPRRSLGYDLAVIGALSFGLALAYGRLRR